MGMWRRNFYFFFIRISVVFWINLLFSPFLQTCVYRVLLDSSRFPMLSVDTACAFVFSPGSDSEGLKSDHLELHWDLLPLRAFSFVLSELTQPERISTAKDLRKLSPFGLMIVWTVDRWTSKFCTWPCENRSWWLTLGALRQRERHLRPYLPRKSIHHRFRHLASWRTYIIVMLHVHHYIVSPVTLKTYYQAFWGVLIELIVELLGLIIKPFDNQTESWNPVSNDLIIKSFDTIIG